MSARPLYLNGEWRTTSASLQVVNAADGSPLERVCTVGRAEVSDALRDAQSALSVWRGRTALERADLLLKVAAVLGRRRDEIARIITRENGKPLAQSLGEVAMSVDHLRWFAEEARRAYGRVVAPQTPGKRHLVITTPIGVVGAISPWNFPLVLAVRKVAPALAAGCPVVLKPASATPLSSLAFAECVSEAGLPAGVFQVVAGRASEIAAEFLENPICRKITFTGSTEVGRLLIQGAAAHVKPLSLELGGHAPFIVFSDADLDRAVEGATIAKFRNTGQSCIAASRIYVERSCYAEFLDRFVARTRQLKVGDGFVEGVEVGPLIDQAGLEKALEHVEDAVSRGARLCCGGKRHGTVGWFLEPTVLADPAEDALCMREEMFAPLAPVCAFDAEEEVVERANASSYGLSAYAYTRDLARTFRLMESLETGTLGINDPVPTTSQCPFGGVKQSGWGRELGGEGMAAFLEIKHVSLGL
ncbi:MAG: NAD-dependent succinate-semialdehyde dehydrogenase [Opitutaceae bacterium]|nr:NAD-dependent succinate-semialdehyde dehydrogenase [Opitutaceae bacterium]